MRLKSTALPSNISLTSGHVLMIPLCGGASAAAEETAFSKDPDGSETISLHSPGRSGKQETKSSKFSPTHIQSAWNSWVTLHLGTEAIPAKPVLFGFSAQNIPYR